MIINYFDTLLQFRLISKFGFKFYYFEIYFCLRAPAQFIYVVCYSALKKGERKKGELKKCFHNVA